MHKSLSKRIKQTRTGKTVRRTTGISHFRTRKSANNLRQKKNTRSFDYPVKKILNAYAGK